MHHHKSGYVKEPDRAIIVRFSGMGKLVSKAGGHGKFLDERHTLYEFGIPASVFENHKTAGGI
jgi:hypothetical protein